LPAEYKVVSEDEIRQRYNESPYPNAIETGELVPTVLYSEAPGPCAPKLPPGSKSERVSYARAGDPRQRKVVVHQFRRPDNSIWGDGRLDPKWLYIDGVIYAVASKPRVAKQKRGGRRPGRRRRGHGRRRR
jgi:hypothetical protein